MVPMGTTGATAAVAEKAKTARAATVALEAPIVWSDFNCRVEAVEVLVGRGVEAKEVAEAAEVEAAAAAAEDVAD